MYEFSQEENKANNNNTKSKSIQGKEQKHRIHIITKNNDVTESHYCNHGINACARFDHRSHRSKQPQ